MKKETTPVYPDINAEELLRSEFLVPYDRFAEGVGDTVKSLLLDAILSMVAGYHSIPKEELEALDNIFADEAKLVRPVLPAGAKMGLEMAGFINGYCLRFADLCDTRRQKVGRGGHTADMIAGILTLCDDSDVTGKNILTAINFGYHLWAALQENMLYKRPELDGVTGLAIVMPLLAGICRDADITRIRNAFTVSASGGPVAVEIRSGGVVTNMKCGATGYALARAMWCWRMGTFLSSTPTIFTGEKGWSRMVAPLDAPLRDPGDDEVYSHIQLKTVPCCNANQAAVECAMHLSAQVKDRLDEVEHIVIRVCKKDERLAIKPGQPQYPTDHPSADHHIRFCTALGLIYGFLSPEHYEENYLKDPVIRSLIDRMETVVIPDEEFEALGGLNGGGALVIRFKDGTECSEFLRKPAGLFAEMSCAELAPEMVRTVKEKCALIERSFGYDLSALTDTVFHLEDHSGKELLDVLHAVLSKPGKA